MCWGKYSAFHGDYILFQWEAPPVAVLDPTPPTSTMVTIMRTPIQPRRPMEGCPQLLWNARAHQVLVNEPHLQLIKGGDPKVVGKTDITAAECILAIHSPPTVAIITIIMVVFSQVPWLQCSHPQHHCHPPARLHHQPCQAHRTW